MKRFSILFMLSAIVATATARTVSLNDGWQFRQSDNADWQSVNLPHTWNTDAYDMKNYAKGRKYYRRKLDLNQSDSTKRYYLRFEGASKSAEVIVNGKKIGHHEGGYTEFLIPLSSAVSFSRPNDIEIIVDNDRDDIPPVSGDFTFFGGIYRDVWLEDYDPFHFTLKPFAANGVRVTPKIEYGLGIVDVEYSLVNEEKSKRQGSVRLELFNPQGDLIDTSEKRIRLDGGSQISQNHQFGYILKPDLWSPDSPSLYRVEVTLLDKDGKEIDRRIVNTGLRFFYFDEEGRFNLNGKPLKLHGICRHQDMKPIGPALSDEMHRRDMLIAKDMGANFIRISHYPQDRAILDMADKLGLLVWEEIPVIDIVPDDPAYARNAEINLREMISQHYNHPSIIMWGYMNEILLKVPSDSSEEGPEIVERTKNLVKRLETICRALDPTRMTTMAFHGSDRYRTTGISSMPMINGWNLYQGWYGGSISDFEKFLAHEKKANPSKPIIVSEYGAGSDRRLHSLDPKPFDFSIEYQQRYLEHYIPVIEDSIFVAGGTHWNLIDFSSAQREESMPGINNKGLLYADRTPKDVYHYFKSAWRSDIDYVYIASRDWASRTAVSDNDTVYMPVKIYANTPKVGLLVNGKSLGDSTIVNNHAVFNVPFINGNNCLIARGGNAIDAFNIDMNTVPMHISGDNSNSLELAINAGSNCFYVSPMSGITWVPDQEYKSGSWGRIGGKDKNMTVKIDGTYDNPLFQSFASGIEAYRFDIPNGEYELELGFADPAGDSGGIAYLLGKDDDTGNNRNTFAITCNGSTIENNFTPSALNGSRFATVRKYIVNVNDGALIISFSPIYGETLLNTIKLRNLRNF